MWSGVYSWFKNFYAVIPSPMIKGIIMTLTTVISAEIFLPLFSLPFIIDNNNIQQT